MQKQKYGRCESEFKKNLHKQKCQSEIELTKWELSKYKQSKKSK